MENKNVKPPLKLEAQVELLKSRGLIISDPNFAIKVLANVNYYRLSAYSLGLREKDLFFKGVTFERVYQLYEFDTKLRHVLMAAIESIEIKLRSMLSYYLAIEHGPMSYFESRLFVNNERHVKLIAELNREKELQKDSAFVKHHIEVYNGDMPIWVAIELLSFGMLSKLYRNLKTRYQKQFVRNYVNEATTFNDYLISWLQCLVEVRNICAHYGRIYNRILSSMPKMLYQYDQTNLPRRRIFPILIAIVNLLDRFSESTTFVTNIQALIYEYNAVNLSFIGFPTNWEEILYKAREI